MRAAVLLAALAVAMGACSDAPETPAPTQTWEVRGVYNGPRAGGQAASITHEAIPDLMDAMRMDLLLADPSVTADLAPGTPIQFTLAEVDGRLVVQDATPLPDTTRLALPSRPDSTDA